MGGIINLNVDAVLGVDLGEYLDHVTDLRHRKIFNERPGQQHYRLLHYLATQVETDIVELGTHYGTGALALATGTNKIVHTFNIRDQYNTVNAPKNLKRYMGNIFALELAPLMLDVQLVFVDTAHCGDFELKVYQYLYDNKFMGILLLDDIMINISMRRIWSKIITRKYDITHLGHGAEDAEGPCGTGLVDFGNNVHVS